MRQTRIDRVFIAACMAVAACGTPRAAADNGATPNGGSADTLPAPRDSTTAPTPGGSAAAPVSPLDSTAATMASGTVKIVYSRPAMRGRVIFGGLVPFAQVWRTGANAATSLITTSDIEINGVRVPKGSYTLYSLPERGARDSTVGSWQLIVNRQTGQWGTEYHAEQDLARIPLRVSTSAEPIPRFRIAVEPAGAGRATLTLAWERTVGTADITARP
jgi:hypothetical protein